MVRAIYLLAAAAMLLWAGAASSIYVWAPVQWIAVAAGGCWILLAIMAPLAAFRRKWLAAALGLLPVILIALPIVGVTKPLAWVQTTGFRIHITPVDEYLSTCRLLTISENNRLQQIGRCRSLPRWDKSRIDIVYDTTGSLLGPADQASPESKAALIKLYGAEAPAIPHGVRITGNFYAVTIKPAEAKG